VKNRKKIAFMPSLAGILNRKGNKGAEGKS
jgi:hypothetical protein